MRKIQSTTNIGNLEHPIFQRKVFALFFAIFNVRTQMRFQIKKNLPELTFALLLSLFCLFSCNVIYFAQEVRGKRVYISESGVKDANDHRRDRCVFALW